MTAATQVDIGEVLRRAVERNLISNSDLPNAAALASIVKRGRQLTAGQEQQASRILERHREMLGTAKVKVSTPAPPPAVIPKPRVSVSAPRIRVRRDGKIGVAADVLLKDALDALPGSSWDRWACEYSFPMTPASAAGLADLLTEWGDVVWPEQVTSLVATQRHGVQARAALSESTPAPAIDTTGLLKPGIELWAHQARSVEFGLSIPASLHAIPMGGGKTLATIAMVNKSGAERVVIVCPNAVRGVWPREYRKFSAKTWHITNGQRLSNRAQLGYVNLSADEKFSEAEKCLFACRCGADVHAAVINYEALSREPWMSWKPKMPVEMVVYDEIQRLKAPTGIVSKAAAKWVDWSERRIGLTGTPMPQSPLDIFGYYRALDPGLFGQWKTKFYSRYAIMNDYIQGVVKRIVNVEELAEKFYSIAYVPTVDLELPGSTDVTRECELEPEAARLYKDLDKNMVASLTTFIKHGAAKAKRLEETTDLDENAKVDGSVTAANIMIKLMYLQRLTGGSVARDDGTMVRVSTAKADELERVLGEVGCVKGRPGGAEPVVVFARFRSPDLDVISEVVKSAGLRYGEVSGRRHDGLTADAEMSPTCDVVGVQIQSGSTGIDLTRSRVGVFYSMGYSLSDYMQARKRQDRPGQDRPVVFIHLLAAGTADYDVYQGLEKRHNVVVDVLKTRGINTEKLGFTHSEAAAEPERRLHGKGGIELPFEGLIKAERARRGAPQPEWKRGAR